MSRSPETESPGVNNSTVPTLEAGVAAIPHDELDAACLRLCRNILSAFFYGLAKDGASFEDIDRRLSRKSGWTWRAIKSLGAGRGTLEIVSDLFLAIDAEIAFRLEPKSSPTGETAAPKVGVMPSDAHEGEVQGEKP